MLSCDKSGEDLDASRFNNEIVIATPKFDAAHFFDAQATALCTMFKRKLLQDDDAVRNAVQLNIALLRRKIVQQKNGAAATAEEVFQSQYLASIAKRVLRQETHFGQAVEYDSRRLNLIEAIKISLDVSVSSSSAG